MPVYQDNTSDDNDSDSGSYPTNNARAPILPKSPRSRIAVSDAGSADLFNNNSSSSSNSSLSNNFATATNRPPSNRAQAIPARGETATREPLNASRSGPSTSDGPDNSVNSRGRYNSSANREPSGNPNMMREREREREREQQQLLLQQQQNEEAAARVRNTSNYARDPAKGPGSAATSSSLSSSSNGGGNLQTNSRAGRDYDRPPSNSQSEPTKSLFEVCPTRKAALFIIFFIIMFSFSLFLLSSSFFYLAHV
jgi:hypothetical protein